jgi:hypothetical protein
MSKHPPCIFCGKSGSKPHDKEDVLPKWIAREFGDEVWKIQSQHSDRVFGARGHLGLVSREVCKQCNNVWMSQLESAAKPILKPMMDGIPSELTPQQQHIVALWFLKTCIMHEVLHDENPRFFSDVDRKALMGFGAISPATLVFLAHYVGNFDILTRENPMDLFFGEGEDPATYGYSATFAIKQLALQIFTFHTPKHLPPNSTIRLRMSADWDRAVIQIWPILGNANWPPPFLFNDEGFEQFTERWKTPQP